MLIVYTVTKYTSRDGEAKTRWTEIGSANKNRDGSLNVYLNALPVNGQLTIRAPKKKDDQP